MSENEIRDTKLTLLIELERMFGVVTALYSAPEKSAQLDYVLAVEKEFKERINSAPVRVPQNT